MTDSGRLAMLVLVVLGAVLFFLIGPVIYQSLMGAFTAQAAKVAPRVFLIGLGVLATGLLTGVEVIAIVGGGLMGLVLLGALLEHY